MAVAIFLVMAVLLVGVWRSHNQQAAHAESVTDVVSSASLLTQVLSLDLNACLPLDLLPEPQRPRGRSMERLVLPVMAGYDPRRTPALQYRAIEYGFDPKRRALTRDGRSLGAAVLASVAFSWSSSPPLELTVALTGLRPLTGPAPTFRLRLPGPARTDRPDGWLFAIHHRGALAEASPR